MPHVGDAADDGCCRRRRRADEMCPHLGALAVLEVAVGGRDNPFSWLAAVAVAAGAHGATGFTPEETSVAEHPVETGSLGVRASTVRRWPQQRAEVTVDVDGHPVRVKVAAGRAKPEHDDAVAAAAALGRPLRDVLRDAETAARRDRGSE